MALEALTALVAVARLALAWVMPASADQSNAG